MTGPTPVDPTSKEAALPKRRQRSPNYPAIGLREAVERVKALYDADKRVGAPIEAAVRHLGFSTPHGRAMAVVSALKKFGLVEDSNNRITPTQRAVSILVYPAEDARSKSCLKEAALSPDVYRELYEGFRHQGQWVSDQTLSAQLEVEGGFNPNAIPDFVKNFKESLVYAGLTGESGVVLSEEVKQEEIQSPLPKVGDYVQWESSGVLHFPVPKRLTGFSGDQKYAFVEGSGTGIPVAELSIVDGMVSKELDTKLQQKPPFMPAPEREKPGMRQDVFSLPEGTVTIQWPGLLSPESFEDLGDWMDILKRKIKRSIKVPEDLSKGGE